MRSLNKFIRIAIVALLAAPISLSASNFPSKASDADLLKLQHSYFDFIIARNPDAAIGLLAENYTGVYADGIIDRVREIKDLKEFPLTGYEMSQENVIFPSSRVAVVNFHLHVKVTVDGKDFFEDDNLSCVWSLQKKGWRMISQAAVKVPVRSS